MIRITIFRNMKRLKRGTPNDYVLILAPRLLTCLETIPMKFFTSSLPNKNQFSVFWGGLVSLFIFLLQITRDKTLDKYLNYEFKKKKEDDRNFFFGIFS